MNLTGFAAGVLVSAAAVSSCDPQAFSMNVEMRYPSASGLDIGGKSVAVVCLEAGDGRDSVFNEYLVNGFASSLENDYFGSRKAIDLFKVSKSADGNYGTVDSLSHFVMETGSDIVFLFDAPGFGEVSVSPLKDDGEGKSGGYDVSAPVTVKLYAYDSMAEKDTVYAWEGRRVVASEVGAGGAASADAAETLFWPSLGSQGEKLGDMSSGIFKPVWKTEQYTFIYFDTPSLWESASQSAFEYKWKEAIEIWMKLADTRNPMRRSCAEYNIAQACYMLGDNELALKWLDASDVDYPVSLSSGLRKRIKARMK